jgi:hypothetical protein
MSLETIRNSPIREFTKRPTKAIAERLHQAGVSADDATIGGTIATVIGVAGAAYLNTRETRIHPVLKAVLSAVLTGVPQATDGVDGEISRVDDAAKLVANPDWIKPDLVHGPLIDWNADRVQEHISTLGRAIVAYKMGGWWGRIGELTAYTALVTNMLPAFGRAEIEISGQYAEEFRSGWEIAGNRFGRAIFGTAAASIPRLQPIIDGFTTVSNVISFHHRMQLVANRGEVGETDSVIVDIAEHKSINSALFLSLAVASAVASYKLLRR